MNEYERAEFLRCQAHECRMWAAISDHPEAKQRWLDLARDYEQQANHIEQQADHIERQTRLLAKRTGTPHQ